MTTIDDGTGKGFKARVNDSNLLEVKAITEPEAVQAAENGDAYAWSNQTFNYSANDTILMIKNTSSIELLVSELWMSANTVTEAVIHVSSTNQALAGTTVTAINVNVASGKQADAISFSNETVNSQGSVIWRGVLESGVTLPIKIPAILLGDNNVIGVDYVTAGTECRITVLGHFETV